MTTCMSATPCGPTIAGQSTPRPQTALVFSKARIQKRLVFAGMVGVTRSWVEGFAQANNFLLLLTQLDSTPATPLRRYVSSPKMPLRHFKGYS